MMRKIILTIASAVILLPTIAMADGGCQRDLSRNGGVRFNGPVEVTPVAELKGITFGETSTMVEGNILRQLEHDKFLFSDGTGEMVVELDDDIRLDQSIDDKTRLRLSGEFETWDNEMEVEWVEIL